jgi:hypothetical protein
MTDQPTVYRVYYMKPEFFRDGICGKKTDDLAATHVYLKDVPMRFGGAACLDLVYAHMQAENWSPFGEARSLIEQKGLQHTSMSVGDVIVVDGDPHVVTSTGFAPLPRSVLRNVPDERGVLT